MVVFNGKPVSEPPANASTEGCFETMRSINGQIPLWPRHYNRLKQGLAFTNVKEPPSLLNFLEHLPEVTCRVRLQVVSDGWILQTTPIPPPVPGIRLVISPVRRKAGYIAGKISDRRNYEKALKSLPESADDVLMLNEAGYVSETARCNVFWMKNGIIYTPSDECFPIRGVLKDVFTEWYNGPLETGFYLPEVLKDAQLVWVSNAVRGFLWVKSVDERVWTIPDKWFTEMNKQFDTFVFG